MTRADVPPHAPGDADQRPGRAGGRWRPLRRWRRWREPTAWVLLALALALAALSTAQWQRLAAVERDRDAVRETATDFMTTLTNWDASDGMAGVRRALREQGTERFADEVDELFGTTQDLVGLQELSARSEGEIVRAHVQALEGDDAVALVVVEQRLVAEAPGSEENTMRYAELDLERDAGPWLVDDVELLVDASDRAGSPPPVGDAPGGAPDAEEQP